MRLQIKRLLQTTVCVVLALHSKAQDLTGVWEGPQHTGGTLKLVLVHRGDSLFGYYEEHSIGWCSANFLGRFQSEKQELKGEGVSFIRKAFGHGLSRMTLQYDSLGRRDQLKGRIRMRSAAANIANFGLAERVTLHRVSNKPDTNAFMLSRLQPATPELPAAAVVVAKKEVSPVLPDSFAVKPMIRYNSRPAFTLRNIVSGAGVFQCTLYDNGVYDGDTVTVLHNDKVVLQNVEVSTRPIRFTVLVSEDEPVHELIFWANNIGSIPPNTGLLLIEGEGRRFEVSLRSDLQNNGKVVIRLRE